VKIVSREISRFTGLGGALVSNESDNDSCTEVGIGTVY